MAERVHTSRGIVLRKYGVGEASLSALILTHDFGLIRVRAQSARNGKGKLRYGLEPLTLGEYSFVRGTQSNRLIGVAVEDVVLAQSHGAARHAAGQLTKLLLRLMPGEAFDARIFTLVEEGLRHLQREDPENVEVAECAIVLALLARLGYLSEDSNLSMFAQEPLSVENLARIKDMRKEAIQSINRALSVSGL